MKKYELTDETKEVCGRILHRIRALIDFGDIWAGDFGGWIEKEENLSHEGNCWVYSEAQVYDNAYVSDNARVLDNACVSDNARVSDYARVFDNAYIRNNTYVYGNARVCENMQVSYSYAKTDLREDIATSLRCQCNLLLMNNKVIAYKIVNKNLSSLYDKNFIYEIGKIAEVKDAEESNKSCASGLHFSNLTYWDFKVRDYADKTYLVAEINVDDIITIQRGKIRCRKAKILGKVDIE